MAVGQLRLLDRGYLYGQTTRARAASVAITIAIAIAIAIARDLGVVFSQYRPYDVTPREL
jgi:hypothetical protein